MPLRRQVHVDAVDTRTEHETVAGGGIGVRDADSGAALRGAAEARPHEHVLYRAAAGTSDHAADDETLLEARVDPVLARRRADRGGRIEARRVVPPLPEV